MGEWKPSPPTPLPTPYLLQFFDILIFTKFDYMIVKSCFPHLFFKKRVFNHHFIVNFWNFIIIFWNHNVILGFLQKWYPEIIIFLPTYFDDFDDVILKSNV